MQASDFDYSLPDKLIARYPTEERGASRLLVVDSSANTLADRRFSDLPSLLQEGDLLVFNDTRVIRARLYGAKDTGGRVEILIERILTDTTALAQVRASKPPKPKSSLVLAGGNSATVIERRQDLYNLEFSLPLGPFLREHGKIPLPPYLNREAEPDDIDRYQTVYAKYDGAVAAPTAGLHFDEELLRSIEQSGVRLAFVTLHVGARTFQPLREADIESNRLHSEQLIVTEQVRSEIDRVRKEGGRIIAVGTTSVRSLETASAGGELEPFNGDTELFIVPGYRFNCVDAMITNFHLPRSSLLMLVAAFAGTERMLDAYQHAISEGYRFFSYGDAMFIS